MFELKQYRYSIQNFKLLFYFTIHSYCLNTYCLCWIVSNEGIESFLSKNVGHFVFWKCPIKNRIFTFLGIMLFATIYFVLPGVWELIESAALINPEWKWSLIQWEWNDHTNETWTFFIGCCKTAPVTVPLKRMSSSFCKCIYSSTM